MMMVIMMMRMDPGCLGSIRTTNVRCCSVCKLMQREVDNSGRSREREREKVIGLERVRKGEREGG